MMGLLKHLTDNAIFEHFYQPISFPSRFSRHWILFESSRVKKAIFSPVINITKSKD